MLVSSHQLSRDALVPLRRSTSKERRARHRRRVTSLPPELLVSFNGLGIHIDLSASVSLPDGGPTTTTSSTTTTGTDSTTTTTSSDTASTTTPISITTITTTTSTITRTSFSTSSRSGSHNTSTTRRTRSSTAHTHSTTTTTTTTTTFTTTTSKFSTFISQTTVYTQSSGTFFTTTSSSQLTPTSVNIPVTSGALGSGDSNNKGFAHNTGGIIGVAIAGLIVVLAAFGLVLLFLRRYRRYKDDSKGSGDVVRPPIDGDLEGDDPQEVRPSISPIITRSAGHGSSGEDGDGPGNISPGSEIHGASVESGVSNMQSQGHSTNSGDHLLGGHSSGYPQPLVFRSITSQPISAPSAWRSGPESAKRAVSPYSLSPTVAVTPASAENAQPSSSRTTPPRSASVDSSKSHRSLFDRLFGGLASMDSEREQDRPSRRESDASQPSPYAAHQRSPTSLLNPPLPPEQISEFHSQTPMPYTESAPWRHSPFTSSNTDRYDPTLPSPAILRERDLSVPEGLLHPKRPDLITQESSRTLMDHVDYSRPILPEDHQIQRVDSTTTDDTKKTRNTEGLLQDSPS